MEGEFEQIVTKIRLSFKDNCTTNCRISFILPTNFRIVFLPHTKTTIKVEPYCGTISEPGLPVVLLRLTVLRWLDTVFYSEYLPRLSVNYVDINKDLDKLTPQLY